MNTCAAPDAIGADTLLPMSLLRMRQAARAVVLAPADLSLLVRCDGPDRTASQLSRRRELLTEVLAAGRPAARVATGG